LKNDGGLPDVEIVFEWRDGCVGEVAADMTRDSIRATSRACPARGSSAVVNG